MAFCFFFFCLVLVWVCLFLVFLFCFVFVFLFHFAGRADLWLNYFGELHEEQNLGKYLHLIFLKSLRTASLTDLLKLADRQIVQNALGL